MKLITRIPVLAVSYTTALFSTGHLFGVDWTPSEISTALWLDASDTSTITSDTEGVSLWTDKSGNGRDASQTAGGARPDTGGTHNSLNVINLDGSTEFFNMGTGLDWLSGGNGNATHTTFTVLNVSAYNNLYGAANGSSGDASLHIGFISATNYRMNRWSNDYNPPITANFVANEFNVMRWTWTEGGAKSAYANAKEEGTGTGGGSFGSSLSPMAGGGRIGNVVGQGFIGADIGEIVMVAGTPDQDTIDRVEGYLAWKWGEQGKLPAEHPYKNAAPQIEGGGSGLAVSSIVYSSATDEVTLTWDSVTNEDYVICYSSDLVDWSGTIPGGPITATGDETTNVIDLTSAGLENETAVYFRVEVSPAS